MLMMKSGTWLITNLLADDFDQEPSIKGESIAREMDKVEKNLKKSLPLKKENTKGALGLSKTFMMRLIYRHLALMFVSPLRENHPHILKPLKMKCG